MKILTIQFSLMIFCAISVSGGSVNPNTALSLQKSASKSNPKSTNRSRKKRLSKKMAHKTVKRKAAESRKKNQAARKPPDRQTKNSESNVSTDSVQNAGQNGDSSSMARGAGTFDGDLRRLPPTKPAVQERPKLREPKIKPKIYVKDKKINPE